MARAVAARLEGAAGDDLVRATVREVIASLPVADAAEAEPDSPTNAMRDNGDGTVTTGLGVVIPRPRGGVPFQACVGCVEQHRQQGNQALLTATGLNRRGVLARLTATVAEVGGDIQDVSQTIVADYFTLILVVDLGPLEVSFAQLKQRVGAIAEELGIHAQLMHEDVMRALQRV